MLPGPSEALHTNEMHLQNIHASIPTPVMKQFDMDVRKAGSNETGAQKGFRHNRIDFAEMRLVIKGCLCAHRNWFQVFLS